MEQRVIPSGATTGIGRMVLNLLWSELGKISLFSLGINRLLREKQRGTEVNLFFQA